MNRPPRNIRRTTERAKPSRSLSLSPCLSLLALLSLSLCFIAQPASAQKRGRGQTKPAAKTQAQEQARARRAKALLLLVETADEARAIEDLLYRARLQALAADALWPFDQKRARAIFRRAWEAATASDNAEREAEALEAGATAEAVETVTEARDEVLAKTARRDSALAGIFLRELMEDAKTESNSEQTGIERATNRRTPSATGARRIALGYELLDSGEAESALKIVAPVVNEGASAALMLFMLRLHERNAAAGDALYRMMIAQMRVDAQADANTVLLLSTPIVSPELMVSVDEHGSLQFQPVARTDARAGTPPPVAPAARSTFFDAAASVLLRSVNSRPGSSEAQERAALYFATARLLPFFEREAAQYVPELQARAAALLNEFTDTRRDALSSQLSLRSLGAPPSTDPLRSHFEELSRTSEQAERDRITIRIVLIAARNRAWDRARRAASELSDDGVRRAANSFIALHQIADLANAYKDEKEDDYESIVSFLKGVEVPPLAAAWGYAQAARIAARKREPQRVAELLTEAGHFAERAPANTSQRVAAYGVIAIEAALLDRQRAWELLTELVHAANALGDDFAGDDSSVDFGADENSKTPAPFTFTADVFRLDSVFATMAHLDFERALTGARALEGDVPRAFAQLAIARAALENK
jgi:hypothetical protein